MAAPTTAACVKKTLANPEPSTHDPKETFAQQQSDKITANNSLRLLNHRFGPAEQRRGKGRPSALTVLAWLMRLISIVDLNHVLQRRKALLESGFLCFKLTSLRDFKVGQSRSQPLNLPLLFL